MASSLSNRSSAANFQLQRQCPEQNPGASSRQALLLRDAFYGRKVGQNDVQAVRFLGGQKAERRPCGVSCSMGEGSRSLAGEPFGARDPFVQEVESNFCDKVLGNADTEHRIKVPILRGIVGLSARTCQKLGPDTKALSAKEANDLRKQILGWKVLEGESGELRLRREWTLRNFQAGLDLFKRIAKVAEEQGHHPDLHLTGWNKASLELYSHELGGLSENDFILAAKIEEIDTSDLIKKIKRFWA